MKVLTTLQNYDNAYSYDLRTVSISVQQIQNNVDRTYIEHFKEEETGERTSQRSHKYSYIQLLPGEIQHD